MSLALIIVLAVLEFAIAFHLHWALGGQLGYSVSLPQRPDGTPVMASRLAWWRPAAAAVTIILVLLGALALAAEGHVRSPVPASAARALLAVAGVASLLRAIVPTPWTGFFKRIRSTRWARYDSWLYSPLFLLLGAMLIVVAFAR